MAVRLVYFETKIRQKFYYYTIGVTSPICHEDFGCIMTKICHFSGKNPTKNTMVNWPKKSLEKGKKCWKVGKTRIYYVFLMDICRKHKRKIKYDKKII